MFRKKHLVDQIRRTLLSFERNIKNANCIRQYDDNGYAEDFLAEFLNAAFGYNLLVQNTARNQSPAIDLGDETAGIAFQITSESTKAKIQDTVSKFISHGLQKRFRQLKILIVGERPKIHSEIKGSLEILFSIETDVIDIDGLTRQIRSLNIATLERIAEVCQQHVPELWDNSGFASSPKLPNPASIEESQYKTSLASNSSGNSPAARIEIPEPTSSLLDTNLNLAKEQLEAQRPSYCKELLEKIENHISLSPAATQARYKTILGSAKLALNDPVGAANCFFEACRLDDTNEKVRTNAAIGHLLLGNYSEAENAADVLLSQNPADTRAYAVKIQSSSIPLDVLVSMVPENLRTTTDVAFAFGIRARLSNSFTEARKWLTIALEHKPVRDPEIQGHLAEVILHSVTDDPQWLGSITEGGVSRSTDLAESYGLFKSAVDAFRGDDAALRVRLSWLINASVVCSLLGKPNESSELLAEARRLAPESEMVVYRAAIVAESQGEYATAIELTHSLQDSKIFPHAAILTALLHWRAGQSETAILKLREFLDSNPPHELAANAIQNLVELLAETGQHQDTAILCKRLTDENSTDLVSMITVARVHRLAGRLDEAIQAIDRVFALVDNDSPAKFLLLLAEQLGELERWSDAAMILKKVADLSLPTALSKKYVAASFNAGQYSNALAVCHQIRESHGVHQFFAEIEFRILEQIGDIPEACRVGRQLVEAYPDDATAQVRLLIAYARTGNFSQVDAILDNPPNWRDLEIEYALQLGQFYTARGRLEEAVKLLYEIQRENDNGFAKLQYLQTFLQLRNAPHGWLNFQAVNPGAAVHLTSDSGTDRWYILEQPERANPSIGELAIDHPLAQQLLGKTVGEQIELRKSFMPEEAKITEITSKYTYAFQSIADVFEEQYPEHQGAFFRFQGLNDEEDVSNFLAGLRARQEARLSRTRLAYEQYRRFPLTIGALGHILNENVLRAWRLLWTTDEFQIINLSRSRDDLSGSVAALQQRLILVIDPCVSPGLSDSGRGRIYAATVGA